MFYVISYVLHTFWPNRSCSKLVRPKYHFIDFTNYFWESHPQQFFLHEHFVINQRVLMLL